MAQFRLYERWTSRGDAVTTVGDDYRWYEARILSEQLTWDEWLLGRGIAATWSDIRAYRGETRTMAHFGYLHYIFHGGVRYW